MVQEPGLQGALASVMGGKRGEEETGGGGCCVSTAAADSIDQLG